MGGRDARAVLIFVILSLIAGSAYRAATRREAPTLVERIREAAEESRLDSERIPAGEERPGSGAPAARGDAEAGGAEADEGRSAWSGARRHPAPSFGALDPDRASAAEWERLPGIGPALAARIVADRSAHGAFGTPEGLARVRGIGPKTIERLRPFFRRQPADSGSPIAN